MKEFKHKKTLISSRDGRMSYLGLELDMIPANQIFNLHRTPQTVKDLAPKMINIPITNGHVEWENIADKVEESKQVGKIVSSIVEDNIIKDKNATIQIKNDVLLNDEGLELFEKRKEVSLGAQFIHKNNEQKEGVPHHLAIVSDGRCGNSCKVLDKKIGRKIKVKHEIGDKMPDLQEKYDKANKKIADLQEEIKNLKKTEKEKKTDDECPKSQKLIDILTTNDEVSKIIEKMIEKKIESRKKTNDEALDKKIQDIVTSNIKNLQEYANFGAEKKGAKTLGEEYINVYK